MKTGPISRSTCVMQLPYVFPNAWLGKPKDSKAAVTWVMFGGHVALLTPKINGEGKPHVC